MKRILIAVLMLALAAGTAHAEPYKLTRHGSYIDMETGLSIPADPANRHYQAVQEWIGAGNVPLADVPSEAELAAMIQTEATRRIDAAFPPRERERLQMNAIHLARKEAKGGASPQEVGTLDQLESFRQWALDVRTTAQNAVGGLDTLTEQEKMNYDPATDIPWPSAPGK